MNIYYKSDFKIIENGISVEAPFRFTYKAGLRSYVVSFDGTNYTNCRNTPEGLIVIFDNHQLRPASPVQVEREYYLTDSDFADNICNKVVLESAGFNLTNNYKDSYTDNRIEVEVCPAYNNYEGNSASLKAETEERISKDNELTSFLNSEIDSRVEADNFISASYKAAVKSRMKRPPMKPIVRRCIPLQPVKGCVYLKIGCSFHARFKASDYNRLLHDGIETNGLLIKLVGIQQRAFKQPILSYVKLKELEELGEIFPNELSGWDIDSENVLGLFTIVGSNEALKGGLLIYNTENSCETWYDNCVIENVLIEDIIHISRETSSPYLYLDLNYMDINRKNLYMISCYKPIIQKTWEINSAKYHYIFKKMKEHYSPRRLNLEGKNITARKFVRISKLINKRGIGFRNLRVYALHRGVMSNNFVEAEVKCFYLTDKHVDYSRPLVVFQK